jgi:hypothetical protein
LAHPKPPLVRGAAEVARPALAAEPLTISTYCPPASKVGCVAGDQSGRSGEAGRAPDLEFPAPPTVVILSVLAGRCRSTRTPRALSVLRVGFERFKIRPVGQ